MNIQTSTRRVPLYEEIQRELLDKIEKGKWSPGDKFLSKREICENYKVSTITANRVLEELVEAGVVERHPGRGNFLKEVLPIGATAEQVRTIGLIAPHRGANSFFTGFYAGVANEIIDRAHKDDREVKLAFLPASAEEMPASVQQWMGEPVCALIYFNVSGLLDLAVRLAQQLRMPAVFIDAYTEGWPSVVNDHAAACIKSVKRLLDLGHRKIGLIANHQFGSNLTNEAERLTIFSSLAREFDLDLGDRIITHFQEEADAADRVSSWIKEDGITALVSTTAKNLSALRERTTGRLAFEKLSYLALDVWLHHGAQDRTVYSGVVPDTKAMADAAYDLVVSGKAMKKNTPAKITIPMHWQEGETLRANTARKRG